MTLVLGVGSSLGVRESDALGLVRSAIGDRTDVAVLATVDRRADEPGIVALASYFGVPLRCFSAAELDGVDVPNPSATVRGHVGTRSVAEAAAMLAAAELGGGELIVPKVRGEQVTLAVVELGASS